MDSYCDSDEEIFFGPMTLKEVKKAAFLGRYTGSSKSFYSLKPDAEDSFKLLETRSEPDLSVEHTPERSRCLSFTENSSLEILKDDEMAINEITIDRIDNDIYSVFSDQVSDAVNAFERKPPLNREDTRFSDAPTCFSDQVSDRSFEDLERQLRTPKKPPQFHSVKSVKKDDSCNCDLNNTLERMEHILKCSDAKPTNQVAKTEKIFFDSPIPLQHRKAAVIHRTPTFKVPFKPVSRLLRPGFGSMEKIPSVSAFPEVVSPVGYYIQHSPSVPKIKNVRPGKPLRSFFSTSQELNPSEHKENIALPAKAYQPAKTTEMIDNTAPSGLPKNNQVKRMAQGIPTPQVIRHERRLGKTNLPLSSRNFNLPENQTKSEESFADLSMVKGDISVCVKKQAFRMQSSTKH